MVSKKRKAKWDLLITCKSAFLPLWSSISFTVSFPDTGKTIEENNFEIQYIGTM